MSYTPSVIETILKAKRLGSSQLSTITKLSVDTRSISDGEQTLFFAIQTESNDGHQFVVDAFNRGVRSFVVSTKPDTILENCTYYVVKDTVKALQTLSLQHRKTFSCPILAITGSNGKTIIKEWLFELLYKEMSVTRSPRSFNSQIGVPLSLWLLSKQTELGIIEAGISQPKEMLTLAKTIVPTQVIIGHIGTAHLENFSNQEELIQEKVKLAEDTEKVFFDYNHSELRKHIQNSCKTSKQCSWAFDTQEASLNVIEQVQQNHTTKLTAVFGKKKYTIQIPFTDKASIENATLCWLYLLENNLFSEETQALFSTLEPIAMRLEVKKGRNNTLLINDSYNSDLSSLAIALNQMNQQQQKDHRQKTLILSDLHESGYKSKDLYQQISVLLAEHKIDRLIGIGPSITEQKDQFAHCSSVFFYSTTEFLSEWKKQTLADEIVLIKGARKFEFNRITDLLQAKAHQTVLEIDFSAMAHNIRHYRSLIEPGTKLMAMVKAFSYGTGSTEVARFLQHQKIDYLAVAIADEGVELRRNGITTPIVVMNPEQHAFDAMILDNLEPNIYNYELLLSFSESLRHHAVRNYPVHLKLDTGMKRLGYDSIEKLTQAVAFIAENDSIKLQSMFTHLAVADETSEDKFTREQIFKFIHWTEQASSSLNYPVVRHVLNTAGIERFAEFDMDMVRLGLGLYGISGFHQNELQQVATLRTTISQIRELEPDETVGYGRVGKKEKGGRIGIIPIGYADGLNRRLSNGAGEVFVSGKRAKFIGNICMDMSMIDLTDIPEASEGMKVEVFGKNISLNEVAETLGTIPYEIMTSVGQRVNREYFWE